MCKKLVVLTSFVLVVVISGVASANLVVPADTTTTRDSDLTDTGYVGVAGHLIVNSGNIQFGSQSWINGPNNVGTGGTRPEITVNGGNLDINARLDMGTGSDAYLTMNSGYFRVGGDLKLPDNAGGTHRIWLNGGTLRVHALQLVSNRDAQIIVGGGVLELEDLPSTSTGSYDPTDWLTAINPAIGEPALVPAEGFVQVVIDYDVPVAGGATVSAIASGLYAGNPNPAEAATGVCPDGAVLSWKPADLMVDPNHDVYLDPNRDDVAQATRASHANVQYYSEDQDSNEYSVPASLQLNTTYHWRVDEVDNGDPCISPIIWSFTTEDGNAFGEMPTNGLRGWSPNSPLITWTPSCMATSQNLYLSTDFNDVNNMVSPIALGAAADSYAPALEAFTTYYWRVETVGGGDGEVWTFKTGYGGLLMQYSFEGSLGADITNPVVDDTGKITFTRYEGGGTLKYGQGRFGGTSALFDSNVGLYRPDPNGPNESDYLRLDGYQYSIHFWVKPTYLSGLDMPDQRLIGKRPGPWGIWINDPGIGEGRDNHFRFVHVGPGSDNVDTADNTAREDEWVHLAAVYNQPDYDVYLNGIWAAGMSRPPLPSDNNNPIGIGCRIDTDPNLVFDQFFDGFIDELKIWDIAVLPMLECSVDPHPADRADRVDPCDTNDTVLTWTPGPFADRHDVYFGTEANNVVYQDTVDGNMYPEVGNLALEVGRTYYWRIDDVDDDPSATYDGFLWRFSTLSVIPDPNMIVWYKFDETDGDFVADSSGHYNSGEIDDLQGDTWDPCDGRFPGCISFHENERIDIVDDVFDYIGESISISVWWKEAYRSGDDNWFCGFGDDDIHMAVRAPDDQPDNPGIIWYAGNDTNDVLEWSTDALGWNDDWHHVVFTKNGPEGTMKIYFDSVLVASTAEANSVTLSQAVAAGSSGDGFRIGAQWDHGDDLPGKADDFRVYDYEISQSKVDELFRGGDVEYAWAPQPIDGATDVPWDAILSWKPGDYAVERDVYFSTSYELVEDANSTWPVGVVYRGRQGPNSYDPPEVLTLGTTYYWRIDEVNDSNVDSPWEGKIWRFTVANFLIVDDVESYDAISGGGNEIFDTWDDGFANMTWSQIALEYGGGAVVHGGGQAMRVVYQNNGFPYYSEIDANTTGPQPGNLSIGTDWTVVGVKALTLFFHGQAGNAAEPMYVQLEDGSSNTAIAYYGDMGEDINDVDEEEWHQWDIALSDFSDSGVILTNVAKVRIGFGNRGNPVAGGSGQVFFDDIRLYLPRCAPWIVKPAVDFSNNCIVDLADVAILADDWLRTDKQLDPYVDPGTADLVGHWELEGDANDSSSYANHGTAEGDYSWVAGVIGSGAIDLHGDGSRVRVPDAAQLRPTAAVTATAWVNYSANQGGGRRVLAKGADANNRESYALQIGGDDQASFFVRDANTGMHAADGTGSLGRNEWIHLAGSYDGNQVKLYINGELDNANTEGPFSILADTNDLSIGNRSDANDRAFIGTVDDVRVYNRALLDSEIAFIATDGTGYFPLLSETNLYDLEPEGQKAVNFRDYTVLLESWLEKVYWP